MGNHGSCVLFNLQTDELQKSMFQHSNQCKLMPRLAYSNMIHFEVNIQCVWTKKSIKIDFQFLPIVMANNVNEIMARKSFMQVSRKIVPVDKSHPIHLFTNATQSLNGYHFATWSQCNASILHTSKPNPPQLNFARSYETLVAMGLLLTFMYQTE